MKADNPQSCSEIIFWLGYIRDVLLCPFLGIWYLGFRHAKFKQNMFLHSTAFSLFFLSKHALHGCFWPLRSHLTVDMRSKNPELKM